MNWDIQDLIFMSRGIYAAACIRHYINCKNIIIRYYTETVIQIFKTYTETPIRCYIGIISRILAYSYDMNKREYGLDIFLESLYNDIQESCSKNIKENLVLYLTVFCPNTEECGPKRPRIRSGFM